MFSGRTVTGHSWLSLPEQEEPQGRAALSPLPNATFIKSAQAVMLHKMLTLSNQVHGRFYSRLFSNT